MQATKIAVKAIMDTLRILNKNNKHIPQLISIVLYDDKTFESWSNTFIDTLNSYKQ